MFFEIHSEGEVFLKDKNKQLFYREGTFKQILVLICSF
jgi:hypothetical protein